MFTYLKIAFALILMAASAVVTHKVDSAHLLTIEKQYADAQAVAVAEAVAERSQEDEVTLNAAIIEANAQRTIAAIESVSLTEVVQYVPEKLVLITGHQSVVPLGFVRVLDAAALTVDPAALPLAAGQSNDTGSPVDAVTLAKNIASNYAACNANAEQLNALEATVTQLVKAANGNSS